MIAVNAAAQVASLAGMLVVQTVYLIVAARILGVEDFGRFSFVFGISQILLLGGDLGLHNTAIRKIAFRRERSPEIFALFFSLKCALSAALASGVALLSLFLRDTRESRATLLLFGIGLFFHSVNLALNIGFQAHDKLYFASLNGFLLVAVNAAVGVAGLAGGGGLVWLGWSYLIACLLALGVNWTLFRRRVHPIRLGVPRGSRNFVAESFPAGLGALFDAAAARIALILLAWLAGNYATGIFSASARVTGALRNVPVAVFGAVLPALALHRGDPLRVRALLGRFVALTTPAAALVAAALWIFAQPLVAFVYGAQYAESASVLRLLALSLVPVTLTVAFNSLLASQPVLFRRLPWVSGAALSVHVASNWILIPIYGAKGAAISSLAGETAAALCASLAVWSFLRKTRPP